MSARRSGDFAARLSVARRAAVMVATDFPIATVYAFTGVRGSAGGRFETENFIIASVIVTALISPASAWDLLGSRDVRDARDRDVIVVEGARQFQRIRLCAYEHAVHIIDLDVHFANGGHQDAPIRMQIPAGGCTRAIDLIGDDRNVTSVEMTYEANTRGRGAHASVRLFGE